MGLTLNNHFAIVVGSRCERAVGNGTTKNDKHIVDRGGIIPIARAVGNGITAYDDRLHIAVTLRHGLAG